MIITYPRFKSNNEKAIAEEARAIGINLSDGQLRVWHLDEARPILSTQRTFSDITDATGFAANIKHGSRMAVTAPDGKYVEFKDGIALQPER